MSAKNTKIRPMTPETKAIDEMAWRGNVTPSEWYHWLKYPPDKKGRRKTDAVACMILSEIVYWYRGSEVLKDGSVLPGVRSRKFDGDVLQKSYNDLAEKFGLGKRHIQKAILRLEAAGLIQRELRNITVKGKPISNVLYLRIFPDRIREITYSVPPEYTDPSHPQGCHPPPTRTGSTLPPAGVVPSHPHGGHVYRDYGTETTDREEEPIALEGLSDSSSKNLPATPGEPKAPPASTTVPAVRDYPKQPSGRADRLAILKAHYADPADRLAKLYRYFEWDQETARQFITRRENGSLPDKTINLLTRYFRKALDMSDSGWKRPGTMRDLLRDIPGTVRVCRIYVDQVDLHAAATDLASVSWGHHGTTCNVLTQAESWVADHPGHLPLDACGDSFIKWPLWAIRVCLAQQGQYFDIDPEEIPRLAEEVADDPLIPIMSFWGTLDPVKVLGLSMDEIRALNKTRVTDRQACVDDLKSLL